MAEETGKESLEKKCNSTQSEKCHSNPMWCGVKHGASTGFLAGIFFTGVLYLADYFGMIDPLVKEDAIFYNILNNKILFSGLTTAFCTSVGLFAGTIKDYFQSEQE